MYICQPERKNKIIYLLSLLSEKITNLFFFRVKKINFLSVCEIFLVTFSETSNTRLAKIINSFVTFVGLSLETYLAV